MTAAYYWPTQGGVLARPGDLVEVESFREDGAGGTRVVLGYTRDGQDLRLSASTDPTDAIIGDVDWYVPAHRCHVVKDAPSELVALACWFDFATWGAP